MDFRYDPTADALYVQFCHRTAAYTHNISRADRYDRGVDYVDDDDTLIGVEFLYVSQGVDLTDVPRAAEIAPLLREHKIRELA